jgi:alkylation response protein AidB-like acyl-CoA dehydrogenase
MVINVISKKAVQVHGAAGLDGELRVERYFRDADARVSTIPDGTIRIQKLITGREISGIRAFR